ncbi:MAG: HAD-IA family hydrolase [Pseudomonadales bacterium]|nr:HAD-IA family hydrolase [Pseudomonadales bacterium]
MSIKTAIFDWDGTVVDSVEHITTSLHQAAAELGFPTLEKAAYRNIIGLGMIDALKRLYPEVEDPDIEAIRQAYSRYFFAREATPQQIFAGMTELIEGLQTRGVGRAVATGKSRRGLDAALQSSGLHGHFDVTRCADETRSKPDPRMLEEILAHYGINARDAVMIGDTTYDLEMAERIGMPSIGVRWGVHEDDALLQHGPLTLVSSVAELQRVLSAL